MSRIVEKATNPGNKPGTASPLPANGVGDEFRLATGTRTAILAVGGELKGAICVYDGYTATLSRCLGNLTDPARYREFCEEVNRLTGVLGLKPMLVAHDLHPDYVSTRFALQTGLPTIGVQHHHAHIVSVMAEHRITKPVIGVCCDGVGFGADHAAWGCEVLFCRLDDFQRLGHLEYFPLLGGDAAAIETWRPALALVRQAFGNEWLSAVGGLFDGVSEKELKAMVRMGDSGLPTPKTSSLGRVFDAVSFLLGLCKKNTHEAQAAIALEQAATGEAVESYAYETRATKDGFQMSLSAALRGIVRDVREGVSPNLIAGRFHETVARMVAATAEMAAEKSGVQTIVLSGGCFANKLLRARVTERLEQRRLQVFGPRRVSCGDGGLALGQAVVAAAAHERE